MPIGSNPMGVGRVLQILIDGNDRMGAIIKTQKNAKLTPQTIPCRISEQPQNKFGCALFGELRGWDTRALPTNLQVVDNFSYPKKSRDEKFQS